MAKRKYHTVLVKYDSKASPWCIHFGDYDKDTAQEELEEIREGYDIVAVKLITTGDTQAAIMARVNELNGKGI